MVQSGQSALRPHVRQLMRLNRTSWVCEILSLPSGTDTSNSVSKGAFPRESSVGLALAVIADLKDCISRIIPGRWIEEDSSRLP